MLQICYKCVAFLVTGEASSRTGVTTMVWHRARSARCDCSRDCSVLQMCYILVAGVVAGGPSSRTGMSMMVLP
jgi:hypothetical protein